MSNAVPDLNLSPVPQTTIFSGESYWKLCQAAGLVQVFQPSPDQEDLRIQLASKGLPSQSPSAQNESERIYWQDQTGWIVWTKGPHLSILWDIIPLLGRKATLYAPRVEGFLQSSVLHLPRPAKLALSYQAMIEVALGIESFAQPADDFWVQADEPSYVECGSSDTTGCISLATLPASQYVQQFEAHLAAYEQTVRQAMTQRRTPERWVNDPMVVADVPAYVIAEKGRPQPKTLLLSQYKTAFRAHRRAVLEKIAALKPQT